MTVLFPRIPSGQLGHSASWFPCCARKRLPRHSLETVSAAGRVSLGWQAGCCCSTRLTLCVPTPQILVHIGFLTEESGDVFSPRVLKGGPLGEMVQWADILATLHVLGHALRITVSLKELQR